MRSTSADVHLLRGDLMPDEVTGGTADGGPATRCGAGDRLARALCSDRELMDDQAIGGLADALARAQESRVSAAIARVTMSVEARAWSGSVVRMNLS